MRQWFLDRGRTPAQIEAAMDLRSRGHHAVSTIAARKAARDWVAEQEALPPRQPR
jgi:hypothetical protein